MIRLSATISGDVEQLFERLKREAPITAKRVIKASAIRIEKRARQLVPVDTGKLRRSIEIEYENGGLIARVTSDVEYAPYVEFGTRKMHAQPFMTPAAEEERPRYLRELRSEVGKLR